MTTAISEDALAQAEILCAWGGCSAPAKGQVCHRDGRFHHHGRVHYDHDLPQFRDRWERFGWLKLCDAHYMAVRS